MIAFLKSIPRCLSTADFILTKVHDVSRLQFAVCSSLNLSCNVFRFSVICRYRYHTGHWNSSSMICQYWCHTGHWNILSENPRTWIAQNQYHSWRWPGDTRSQGIISYDFDPIYPSILWPVREGWNSSKYEQMYFHCNADFGMLKWNYIFIKKSTASSRC